MILVIGGSGMLSGLCETLAQDDIVAVVGRDPARLQKIAAPGRIWPVAVDYRDTPALRLALEEVAATHGRPRRTVCWSHDDKVPLQVAGQAEGVFWHILSSAAADPAQPQFLAGWRERFAATGLDYRQVVLGFVVDGASSRWLSNAEISDGVWQAIQGEQALAVVGTMSPWSRRP
jgi:hypothetical protein